MNVIHDHHNYLPSSVARLENPQTDIPRIAKDKKLLSEIESAVQQIQTSHRLIQGDARKLSFIEDESVHLVVTSPPYWTLKNTMITKISLGMWKITRNFSAN